MVEKPDKRSRNRSVWQTVLIVAVAVVLYAYATQATDINLEEPLEPRRQENLVGLLRTLAHPDLFATEEVPRTTNVSLRMPCPEAPQASQVTAEGRQLLLSPNCASTTQDRLTLTGQGFQSNVRGVVQWYPPGSSTVRRVAEFRADAQGNFSVRFTLPDIRETEESQRLAVVEILERRITGFSETSKTTFDRIIETILMALMASTIGTILAVPISFLAARNLMTTVGTPLAALMAAILAAVAGGWVGWQLAAGLVGLAGQLTDQAMLGLGTLVVAAAVTWPVLRLGPPVLTNDPQPAGRRLLSTLRLGLAGLLFFFVLALLGHLGAGAGRWLEGNLGILGFVGNFIAVLFDMLRISLPLLVSLTAALVAASFSSNAVQETLFRLKAAPARLLTALLAAAGTAVFIVVLVYALNWLCFFGLCRRLPQEFSGLLAVIALPAAAGGLLVALLSLRAAPKQPFPIGTIIYTLTRGLLNALRSIEPVMMGFVFVAWVGIGPFAGILALTLNSVADLGKLFSEQVENIAEGPLEAVTATGANRLQTIVFAVIPQVVPHYLAFIFYRWDINVRLSTIIGLVGGGGIGLIINRSVNLTLYQEVSVMIMAIAVVVVTLDYVSSRIRRRVI
ncbi:MAG: ABC transporter permease subunit [Chloroflexi bacterium]|nr:ABC transporter permease subunit [Chloroflexota bacterium]